MLPCHLIAGPLGAGKSTAILEYLSSQAGAERIAVLTNDFGRTGLDAEIIRSGGAERTAELWIENIPGGCLCCSSMADFRGVLAKVLEKESPTRVIVEPSGLAILSDTIPYLRKLCEEFGLHLAPVIVILNPTRVKHSHYDQLPFFTDLVDHSDILVGNRMDQCDEADRAHFSEWTHALRPPKQMIVETSFGRLPQGVFSLEPVSRPLVPDALDPINLRPVPPHVHREHPGGFREVSRLKISTSHFCSHLEKWAKEGLAGGAVHRFKALLPTEAGWRLFEIADASVYSRSMPEANSIRLDWITEKPVDESLVREALGKCSF